MPADERVDLLADERFSTSQGRRENNLELVRVLDDVFKQRTLAEWEHALGGSVLPWSAVRTPREVLEDPQAVANEYFSEVVRGSGRRFQIAASPVQFDEESLGTCGAAPAEPGQHSEQVLLESGKTWDDITELKEQGAVQ